VQRMLFPSAVRFEIRDESASANMRFVTHIASRMRMERLSTANWPLTFCIRSVTALFLALVSLVAAGAQEVPPELATFLRDQIGLTTRELASARRGEVIAKVLPSEKQEVAVFGIVLVKASADFFVERFRDIESYKKGTSVLLVRKFSDPPRMEDLDQLNVDKKDFVALKNCKIGDCGVKLSADTIERLRKEIDWNAPDASEQVNKLARVSLLEYVKRYLAGGNMALSEYNDKTKPQRIADEFDAILKASPYIYDYEPEFYEYLREYPGKHLDNLDDFIYWSKEKFGLKPVISVTHVSIYRRPGSGHTLIASKQIYASHYFEASLGLTDVIVSPRQQEPSFYLIYLNRSRADALHGGFSGLARGQVKSRARSGLEKNMGIIKLAIENLYRRN
jgi:hypothetical protein